MLFDRSLPRPQRGLSEISSVLSPLARSGQGSLRWRPNVPTMQLSSQAPRYVHTSTGNLITHSISRTVDTASIAATPAKLLSVLQQRHSSSSIMHLLLLARSLPTESVVSTLLEVKSLGDAWADVIKPRSVYAVMRVLEERDDLKSNLSEPVVLEEICSLLTDMMNLGLNPVCRVITGICFDVVSEPRLKMSDMTSHVKIISYLSTASLNPSGNESYLQDGSPMALMIRKIVMNISDLLSNGTLPATGVESAQVIKALGSLITRQHSYIELERLMGGERGTSNYKLLRDSFQDLIESKNSLISGLGPDATISLLRASTFLDLETEWGLLRQVLSAFNDASAAGAMETSLWGKALGFALASFHFNDESELDISESLTAALKATLLISGEGMTFIGYLTEQIYQRHRDGSKTPITILIAQLTQRLAPPNMADARFANLLAASCRCLVESQPSAALPQSDYPLLFNKTLKSSMALLSEWPSILSAQGLCDGFVSAALSTGHVSILKSLGSLIHANALALSTVPPRTIVAILDASLMHISAPSDNKDILFALQQRCGESLSSLPVEKLERALSPPRKIQLLQAAVKMSRNSVNDSSGLVNEALLHSCIGCIQQTAHLLSPSQAVGVLGIISRKPQGAARIKSLPSLLSRLSLHLNSRVSACSNKELILACKSMAMLAFQPGLLLSSTLSRVTSNASSVSNENLLWLAWSLAKLEFKKPMSNIVIKESIDRAMKQDGTQLNSSQLAVLIWVCGRLGFRNDKVLKPVLLQLLKAPTSEHISIRLVANVVWACARLGFSTELLAAWSLRQLGPKLEALESCSHPQTICNLAWGLWRIGHKPQPRVLSAFVTASERCIESLAGSSGAFRSPLKPTELVALLAALSGWGAGPSKSFFSSVEHAMQAALKSKSWDGQGQWPADVLVGCTWSIVNMGHTISSDTLEAVARVLTLLSDSSNSIEDSLVCNFLWACYSSDVYPEVLLASYTSQLTNRLKALSGLHGYSSDKSRTDGERPCLNGSDLAEIANALGLFKWSDNNNHLPSLLESAAMRTEIESSYLYKPSVRASLKTPLPEVSIASKRLLMSPKQLSKFLHGLFLLGHCPHRWIQSGLPRALRTSIPEMELNQLSRCIAAVGSWNGGLDLSVRRQLVYQCFDPALDAVDNDIPSAESSVLLLLLSGLSSLGLYKQKTVEAIVSSFRQPDRLDRLRNQELTSLLSSMAHLKHYAPQLMGDIASEIQRRSVWKQQPLQSKDVVGFLWSSSKFNLRLKPTVLDSLSNLSLLCSDDSFQDLTTVAYSLAIMRQHNGLLANQAASAIAEKLSFEMNESQGLPPSFIRQLDHVAAILLSAQAEGLQSPLSHLMLLEIQEVALQHWKSRIAVKMNKRPNRYLHEVAAALKRMGFRPQLGVTSSDGTVSPDILVVLDSHVQVAIEMVGKHNSDASTNSTILGEAALKLRLLQSKGFIVLTISCSEWDRQEKINKSLYIQEKLAQIHKQF